MISDFCDRLTLFYWQFPGQRNTFGNRDRIRRVFSQLAPIEAPTKHSGSGPAT